MVIPGYGVDVFVMLFMLSFPYVLSLPAFLLGWTLFFELRSPEFVHYTSAFRVVSQFIINTYVANIFI
jgi:hypothetical protein